MFQFSITVWEKINFNNIIEDKEQILKNIVSKKKFIDKLLNNLTLTLQTTTRNIYLIYIYRLHEQTTNLQTTIT